MMQNETLIFVVMDVAIKTSRTRNVRQHLYDNKLDLV